MIILRLTFEIPIPCYAYHYLLGFLLLPFAESSRKYYESNFECLEIEAESHRIKVADIFIPLVSLM